MENSDEPPSGEFRTSNYSWGRNSMQFRGISVISGGLLADSLDRDDRVYLRGYRHPDEAIMTQRKRIKKIDKGDAIVDLGIQTFYENARHLSEKIGLNNFVCSA